MLICNKREVRRIRDGPGIVFVDPVTPSASSLEHVVTAGGSYSLGSYDVHLGLLAVLPGSRKTADTLYFGGGTPSRLGGEGLAHLIESLRSRITLADDAEVVAGQEHRVRGADGGGGSD